MIDLVAMFAVVEAERIAKEKAADAAEAKKAYERMIRAAHKRGEY